MQLLAISLSLKVDTFRRISRGLNESIFTRLPLNLGDIGIYYADEEWKILKFKYKK